MISVLYVDDEQVLLDICKIFLERTGDLQVQTESSVRLALDRISHETFDVIITDYQMPEMDGIEFLKRIRATGNATPVIIFTGRGREEVAIAALKEGADFYLQKGGDPSSQFAELSNQIRQIVRQRKAEYAVRENEQKYRALFESAYDAIFLLDHSRIIECNRQMARIFGRSQDDLLGLSLADLSPSYQSDGSSSRDAGLFRIETALCGTPQSFEWKHQRSDGSLFDGELSLNRIAINKQYVLLAVLRDITSKKRNEEELHRKSEELAASYEELVSTEEELKTQYQMLIQSEQELRENEATLSAIIQGSPIPQFVIDTDHRVIHWNNALTVYSRIAASEILGTDQHWRAFYPEKRPCMADLLLDQAIYTLPEWYGDKYTKSILVPDAYTAIDFFPHMGEDGIWLSFTATLIRNHTGVVIGALETLEDITSQKRSALALAESESRYRGVIENLQDIFYRSDLEGRLIMASPSMLPLLGYDSLDQCIGRDIAETFYANPVDREAFRSVVLVTGSVTNYLVTLKKRDGTPVPVSTSSHIYFGADGKPAGIEGTFRDISKQVETEARLRRGEAILTAVIEESPVPLFVIDNNHRVMYWNRALEKYSGIRAQEIYGTSQQWRAFYQNERPCLADLLVQEDTRDIPRWYPDKYAPSRLIDGAYEAVDYFPDIGEQGCWLYFTAAPIRDSEGKTIGAVEILQDITERKNTENSLMESEERFRTLFTHANDAIFLHRITSDGLPDVFVEVNDTACKRLGYSREELLTMSPHDIDGEDSMKNEKKFTEILNRKGHATFEAVHITRSGDHIPVEISAHIYEFRGEKMVLSIARDISERKRYESAIRNANNKLNLLSNITRHDILNQLTALTGYLELSEEITDNTEIHEFIRKEKKAVDTILRQILFTKDYQTIGIQSPLWQRLASTIERAVHLLDTGTVTVQVDLHQWEVFADPMLEKVFFNLIDNSLRYGKKLTEISFSIDMSDSQMILVCSDNGGGIPPEEKENIFTRKYFNNTGFGLFLSREILAITGLSVSETGEYGKGARFEIIIPKGSYRLCT